MEEKKYLIGDVVEDIGFTDLKYNECIVLYKNKTLPYSKEIHVEIIGFVYGSRDVRVQYMYTGRYYGPNQIEYNLTVIINDSLAASYYDINNLKIEVIKW